MEDWACFLRGFPLVMFPAQQRPASSLRVLIAPSSPRGAPALELEPLVRRLAADEPVLRVINVFCLTQGVCMGGGSRA